jgi:putative transposase
MALHYAGKAMQNGCIESFDGRQRDKLLNETLFWSLAHEWAKLGFWRTDHNTARPHSQLGWSTPADFAAAFVSRRALALRSASDSAPIPVASPAHSGIPTAGYGLPAEYNVEGNVSVSHFPP